jgi:hypothetical protein
MPYRKEWRSGIYGYYIKFIIGLNKDRLILG